MSRLSVTFVLGCGLPLVVLAAGAAAPSPATLRVRATNLASQQRILLPVSSNGVFTVQGVAEADLGVSNVWFRLNGGSWSRANGAAAWAAPLGLTRSANLFQVYAEDGVGNHSRTGAVAFTYAAFDSLSLQTTGLGTVRCSGGTSGLEVGKQYSLLAVPAPGQRFYAWSGAISSRANPLVFVMQPGMSFEATFIPNPFPAVKGDYNGLFYPADVVGGITAEAAITNCGLISVKVGATGAYSGKLVFRGASRPFAGAFDLDLASQVGVAQQPGWPRLGVSLQLDADSMIISGTVGQDLAWQSSFLARRAAKGISNQYAGSYTLLLRGCDREGACFLFAKVPYGDSPAAVRVRNSGAIQMTGTLADGTAVSQATVVADDGSWPLYSRPSSGGGMVIGWMNLTDPDRTGGTLWIKPPSGSGNRYYHDGFSSLREPILVPYHPPLPTENPLNWTNGLVVLDSGNLPARMTNWVWLVNNRLKVVSGSISNLTLALTPSSGLFRGTFLHPASGRITAIRGAVVQDTPALYGATGGGWFLGADGASGPVRLKPPP